MDEVQLAGYAVSAVVILGGFISIITKFTQPINDLRVVIQKLNDNIDSMKRDDEKRDHRIDKHGEKIDELDGRVGKLEMTVDFHHKD